MFCYNICMCWIGKKSCANSFCLLLPLFMLFKIIKNKVIVGASILLLLEWLEVQFQLFVPFEVLLLLDRRLDTSLSGW